MSDFTPIGYPILGGVDTKVSGVVLPAPKLQRAENVYSDKSGSLRRRFGRTSLVNTDQSGNPISGWVATGSYQDRLVGFTPTKMYEYDGAGSGPRWQDRGRCTSWKLTNTPIASQGSGYSPVGGAMDVATAGDFRCYGYDTYTQSGTDTITTTLITIVDSSGMRYASDFQLATVTNASQYSSGIRVVGIGTLFWVIYYDVSTASTLKCRFIDATDGSGIAASLLVASTTLVTDLYQWATDIPVFDACANDGEGEPFLAYQSTIGNTIIFGFVNASGAVVNASTTTSGVAQAYSISVDVASNDALHGVVWSLNTTPDDLYAAIRSWNGSAWSVIADSTALAPTLTNEVLHHACKWDSLTTLRVYYDGNDFVTYQCVYQSTFTTAGAVSQNDVRLNRAFLGSKPFSGPDGDYFWATQAPIGTTTQPTLFLVKSDGTFAGVANQGINVGQSKPFLSHADADSNGLVHVMAQYYTNFASGAASAFRDITVDFANSDSHVTVEDGQCLYIPSSVLQYFDGASCVEVGFHEFVDTAGSVVLTASNSTGSLTNSGVYGYRVVPEWVNAKGEREQGTDNGPKLITLGGADDTVTVRIDTIWATMKQSSKPKKRNQLVFAVYRTATGATTPTADSPHYRVGTIPNDPTVDTVTFTDTMSDAIAQEQEELYADVELSNLGPSPGYILAAGNGRVFVAGLPEDPSLVLYSKQRGHGQPLAFNPALSIQMPQSAGDTTSLAVLDEQLVSFTRDNVFRVVGDGANNVGGGAGFAPPVVVTSAEAGALAHRGTKATTIGLVYQSIRGLILLKPSLDGGYNFGAPLEGLGDPGTCRGIAEQDNLQLIHFAFDTVTHVYDHYHSQWYSWTHHSDGPISVWNDYVVGVQNDEIQVGDTATWTDGVTPYSATVVLGWEKGSGTMQGDISFRRVAVTGASLASHYLDIQLAQDYDSTTTQTDDSTVVSAGVLRKRLRVARQKANSLQVTIRDAILDAYGLDVVMDTAGWRLNELTFEVRVRGGLSHRRIP